MSDPASAISGIGSLAGAMGGGGGGGGGGGTVVGGPSPAAAMQAASMQANAAKEAAKEARLAVNDAILSINKNYSQARYDVQPYRQEGVQALNQLNQYLGLDAYNPGAAPTAPKEFTVDALRGRVSSKQLKDYITDNSEMYTRTNSGDRTNTAAAGYLYTGFGSDSAALQGNARQKAMLGARGNSFSSTDGIFGTSDSPTAHLSAAMAAGMNGMTPQLGSAYSNLKGITGLSDQARTGAAMEMYEEGIDAHNQEMSEYGRNKSEWQQNLDWYNQYTAEGPKSQQQITDEISAQPGFQAELNQGIESIGKSGAARGYVGSGRILKELSNFGQNTLSKYYNNTLDRLGSLAGMGAQAASQSSQMSMNRGNVVGQAKIGLGDTLANAKLAAGNAMAQGTLAANQEYKVIGGSKGGGGMK